MVSVSYVFNIVGVEVSVSCRVAVSVSVISVSVIKFLSLLHWQDFKLKL